MENFETFRLDQTGQQTQAILDQVSTNTADIAQLRALYEALTQSEPVIIQPSDTWPVADPQENVIYRVIDRVNTPPQSYSDYMWNGTAMVLMATYNNPIDNEPTPGSNNLVKSGGVAASIVFDISAYHATGSTLATYADLAAALGTDGANVPASVRKGGMSVKFVQSSDNKYVQYRLMATSFSTSEYDWQGVDDVPTADSENLVKSGGISNVSKYLQSVDVLKQELSDIEVAVGTDNALLYSDGGLSGINGFYVSEYIDVSDISYDYYITFTLGLSNFYGKCAFYDSSQKCICCITGIDVPASKNSIYKLVLPTAAKYLRISGSQAYPFKLQKAPKRTDTDIDLLFGKNCKFLDGVLTNESELELVNVTTVDENTILRYDGDTSAFNGFCVSEYIDVSDITYDYYFVPKVSVNYYYGKIAFYDSDKFNICTLNGADIPNLYNDNMYRLCLPLNAKYIRVLANTSNNILVYKAPKAKSIEKVISNNYAPTNAVLWLGTSIPAGSQYPQKSCMANGYSCINNSLGDSSLAIRSRNPRCLTYTEAEFREEFEDGIGTIITQDEFDTAIRQTYELSVLPFINGESKTVDGYVINPDAVKVSAIVIDHGYNDYASINSLMENEGSIDWDSVDRTNFVGAFNYIVGKIQEINPTIKIVVGGYFDYTLNTYNKPTGKNICDIQSLLADRYSFEILKVWNYSQINYERFVQGSRDYIDNINQQYGTSFVLQPWDVDENGDIRSHKIYCPDGIHPFSDPTGNSQRRLNAVYTKLMRNII